MPQYSRNSEALGGLELPELHRSFEWPCENLAGSAARWSLEVSSCLSVPKRTAEIRFCRTSQMPISAGHEAGHLGQVGSQRAKILARAGRSPAA